MITKSYKDAERCRSGWTGRSRKPLSLMGSQGSNPCLSAIFLAATVSLRDGCRQNSQLPRCFQDETVDLASGRVSQNLSLPANSLWSCWPWANGTALEHYDLYRLLGELHRLNLTKSQIEYDTGFERKNCAYICWMDGVYSSKLKQAGLCSVSGGFTLFCL